MEQRPQLNEQEQLRKYAVELYGKVDFMFQRRGIYNAANDDSRYGELNLDPAEVEFVSSAFVDNFVDAPSSIEITLLGNTADSRGVLVITQHEDHDSIYSFLYTVCVDDEQHGSYVTKDVRRSSKEYGVNEHGIADNIYLRTETIYDDSPTDQSERNALMELINKL